MSAVHAINLINPGDLTEGNDEIDKAGNERCKASIVSAQVQLPKTVLPVELRPQVAFHLIFNASIRFGEDSIRFNRIIIIVTVLSITIYPSIYHSINLSMTLSIYDSFYL